MMCHSRKVNKLVVGDNSLTNTQPHDLQSVQPSSSWHKQASAHHTLLQTKITIMITRGAKEKSILSQGFFPFSFLSSFQGRSNLCCGLTFKQLHRYCLAQCLGWAFSIYFILSLTFCQLQVPFLLVNILSDWRYRTQPGQMDIRVSL